MIRSLVKVSTKVTGMHSGITGKCSVYLSGDVTECKIEDKERKFGVDVTDLIKKGEKNA